MELTPLDLNRTLLARQHLLERVEVSVPAMAEHLIGLQAQENLPPYLSLAARLESFDPLDVTRGLEDRSLVRLVCLRGTIHLLTPADALSLRLWTQPVQDRERRASQTVRPVAHLETEAFNAAVSAALADRPLPMKKLGEELAVSYPDLPPTALAQLARVTQPLAQMPPRGCWKQSGGVVLQYVDRWLEQPLSEPDPSEIVRRYLRAFGPASATDVGAWSGLTRLGPLLAGMPDLITRRTVDGKELYDVPDAPLVSGDAAGPVRLLGAYDNVWLSHAGRDRVTDPVARREWSGVNGASANTILVDGWLQGLWRLEDGRITVVHLTRELTRAEQRQLDAEVERTQALLDS